MNFKDKYLKYKNKYLKLKAKNILKLKGGHSLTIPTSENDKIYLVSWNVLNPNININKMTYNFFSNNFATDIAIVDNLRFNEFRKNAILQIIQKLIELFEDNIIICLQEVNENLLSDLTTLSENKNFQIVTTSEHDDDYRVTIMSIAKWGIVTSIKLFEDIPNVKSGLLTFLQNNDSDTDKNIKILNVHFPYCVKNVTDYQAITDEIRSKIVDENNTIGNFLICGDYNSLYVDTFSNIFDFLPQTTENIKVNNININFDNKSIIHIDEETETETETSINNKFTSLIVNGLEKPPVFGSFGIIDHILGNVQCDLNIINNVIMNDGINYEIFYDVNNIIENVFQITDFYKKNEGNKILNNDIIPSKDKYNIPYIKGVSSYEKNSKTDQHMMISREYGEIYNLLEIDENNNENKKLRDDWRDVEGSDRETFENYVKDKWIREFPNKYISDHLPIITSFTI